MTGFHPHDADWTRGRGQALADAERLVRRQASMSRRVVLNRKEIDLLDEAEAIRAALTEPAKEQSDGT